MLVLRTTDKPKICFCSLWNEEQQSSIACKVTFVTHKNIKKQLKKGNI